MDITTATRNHDKVNTYELKDGDLVLAHGMLLRLTEGRETSHGAMNFLGVMENPDTVPASVREITKRNTWTVQGNELATWMRVRES
ncbi:hypothetical protein [Pseudonocardia sp. NPDC049635]|uniref:hypothetical protein n=1 Tax=Pseudonocardia sp. NPDC049635 TaxID=3155506 RepID=UPI0033D5CC61